MTAATMTTDAASRTEEHKSASDFADVYRDHLTPVWR